MASGDTTWRDALILDAPRIAGIRVRPLSAWHCHVAQMMDIRLGFCDDGRGPTPGDIANCIVLCRSIYRPGRTGVPVAGWWLRRVYLPIRWAIRSWRRDAFDLCRYVDAYRRYPEVARHSGKDSSPLGAPPYYAVAVDVAARMPSLTLSEALNMPLLDLYCLRATLIELDGGTSCAWRSDVSPDDVENGLKSAEEAIARYNARKGEPDAKPQS